MVNKVISFGCSFIRHSHDNEEPWRPTKGIHTPISIPKQHKYLHYTRPISETCAIEELADKLSIPSYNRCIGGSGNRAIIYRLLDYIKNNDVTNNLFIIGLSEMSRFDFINPTIAKKWPKLPVEDYTKFYVEEDVKFELTTLIELTSLYLNTNNINHLFVNTMNNSFSTKDVCNTLIFPNGTEYWRDYILSYDDSYKHGHPNIDDHKKLANIIYEQLDI
jgi:hypothetical protein